MNSVWKTFLESRSARIDDAGKVRFPDAPVEAECALMALSPLGLVAVSGPEAETFLQGQVTHDVTRLSAAVSRLGSHCSPKGRMLASFRTFRRDDTTYLQLPRTQVEALTRRLRMYLLRAKATIEDVSERFSALAIAGNCAPSLLASRLAAVPTRENGVTQDGELITIRIPGPTPRFQLLGPPAALEAIWDDLVATATVVNAGFWSLLDIRAGIPTLYRQTSDAFAPQMANLHLLDGVSFKKGCYTGQEVVARMQYLGKLKRRMYLGQVGTTNPPVPGDLLYAAGGRSEQATGRVVDAGINDKGNYELLAVVEIEVAERGEVRLGGPDGPSFSLRDPPYGFPVLD